MRKHIVFAVLLAAGALIATPALSRMDGFLQPRPRPVPLRTAPPVAPDVPELLGAEEDLQAMSWLFQPVSLDPLPPAEWTPLDPIPPRSPWMYVEIPGDIGPLGPRPPVLTIGGYGPPTGTGGSGYTY